MSLFFLGSELMGHRCATPLASGRVTDCILGEGRLASYLKSKPPESALLIQSMHLRPLGVRCRRCALPQPGQSLAGDINRVKTSNMNSTVIRIVQDALTFAFPAGYAHVLCLLVRKETNHNFHACSTTFWATRCHLGFGRLRKRIARELSYALSIDSPVYYSAIRK